MSDIDWEWNEMQQVGTDYADLAQVEAYDERMGAFRDVEAENRAILNLLGLPSEASVLEIGCGTGRFARATARTGCKVTAIDVSEIMLEYVRQKSSDKGMAPIITQHAGFLSMDFAPDSFDAVVSSLALHHLPDLWKMVALRHVAQVLKPGGQFLLFDVVFSVDTDSAPETSFERFAGLVPDMRGPAARHIAQEFSTYDWIMEGLLERAGLAICSQHHPGESIISYHCRKR